MNDQRKLVLLQGLKNHKPKFDNPPIIGIDEIERIYSSRASAKSAAQSLVVQGYLEKKQFGRFQVKTVPEEVWELLERDAPKKYRSLMEKAVDE